MVRRRTLLFILLVFTVACCGCGKKDSDTLARISSELNDYEDNMLTFYEFKKIPDDPAFPGNITIDYLDRAQQSADSLMALSQYGDAVKDKDLKKELQNFISIAREREKLVVKYLDDIRKDLNFESTGQIDLTQPDNDLIVDINRYIHNIPGDILEMEYQLKESRQKMEPMLSVKKK